MSAQQSTYLFPYGIGRSSRVCQCHARKETGNYDFVQIPPAAQCTEIITGVKSSIISQNALCGQIADFMYDQN